MFQMHVIHETCIGFDHTPLVVDTNLRDKKGKKIRFELCGPVAQVAKGLFIGDGVVIEVRI